jgi:hypothetical protein
MNKHIKIMERHEMCFIFVMILSVVIPITIGLYGVKNSMDKININEVSLGMNGINSNLAEVNNLLGELSNMDIELIRNVFYLMNKTLNKGIVLNPQLVINSNNPMITSSPSENIPTVEGTDNLRRI